MATKILAAGVGTCLIGGGSLYTYRQTLITQRRSDLAKEHEDLTVEIRNCDKKLKAVASTENADRAKIDTRRRAIDTLWADRLQRYADTNEQLKSYIIALPEAIGVVNGLTNHYHYLTEATREYFSFDVWASKSHNFALLLSSADTSTGVVPVIETLQGLFGADELVENVCTNVLQTAKMTAAPRTVGEVNTSFSFCMEQLDVAVLAAAERYEAELSARHAHRAPNVVIAAVNHALQLAKLPENDQAAEEARLTAESVKRRQFRQLTQIDDVKSALRYVDDVSKLIESRGAHGEVDFPSYALRDGDVVGAVKQLKTWEEGATAFLVQDQAKQVLKAYFDLNALPLTTIREKQEEPSTA